MEALRDAIGRDILIMYFCKCRFWFVPSLLPALFILLIATPAVGAQPEKQVRYWTTNWSFDDIDIGKLLSRLARIGIEVPVQADGDVSINFSVSVPLNALRDAQAYRFNGTLSSRQLRLEQLQLSEFGANVRYDAGVISLNDLSTRWDGDARLRGEAQLQLVPRGDLTTSIEATELTLGPLYNLILAVTDTDDTAVLQGTVDGDLSLQIPFNSLSDVTTWTVTADLMADDLTYDDTLPLTLKTGPMSLEMGQLTASDVKIGSPVDPSVRIAASVKASVRDERAFEVEIRGDDVPMSSMAKLASLGSASPVTGKLDIKAQGTGKLGRGDLSAATWNLQGSVASPQLVAGGVNLGLVEHEFEFDAQHFSLERLHQEPDERILIERLNATYNIAPQTIQLSNLDAALFGGTLSGSAVVTREGEGTNRIQLQWQALQPRFETGGLLPASVEVSLRTSGDIDWTVPAAQLDNPNAHQGSARIAIDNFFIGSESVGEATLALQAAEGQLSLKGDGTVFGGTFQVDTTMGLAFLMPGFNLSAEYPGVRHGGLSFNRVRVAEAARLILPSDKRRWDGYVSGNVEIVQREGGESESVLVGSSKLTLDQLAMDGTLLSSRIDAELEIADDQLMIRSLRGGYAGGRVEAVGDVRLSNQQGRFVVRIAAVDASRGLMPLSTVASDYAEGSVSGRLIIEIGNVLRARGAMEIRDSGVASIRTGTAHASIAGWASSDFSRWSIDFQSIQSTLNEGRIFGEAKLSSSSIHRAFNLRSEWKATRLDFGLLLKDAGVGSSYARGNLTGDLTLNGMGVRGFADLVGRFDAKLDGTQARAVPGLQSVQAYLGAFSLAGARVEQGRMRGSIAAGAARIDEFRLLGEAFRVLADGRVRIPGGQMDMTAVISTGNFDIQAAAASRLAQQVALDAALPVAALIEVNRLLSNRTLYVDVLGPLRDPRLRLKPLDTLGASARRLIVREAIGAVVPFAVGSSLLNNQEN